MSDEQVHAKVSIINDKNLGEVSSTDTYTDLFELASIITEKQWAPATFKEGKRLIKNLESISLLVLDIDSGCELEGAKRLLGEYKHIIATSRNHQKEKNGVVCDRYRVVLFLDEPILSDADFKATWQTAFKRWPFIDEACKDSSRFFYPSPEIVSINSSGRSYPVSIHIAQPVQLPTPATTTTPVSGERGSLWKETLEFLIEGAAPGTRHHALVKAVGNMREQGYTQPEVLDKLQNMIDGGGDWTTIVTKTDIKTIERMYEREMKYPFQKKEEPKKDFCFIVNASELLDETFEYLADKDKVKGDATGIEGLDRLLGGGFRTGELTVLMAQAKTGKNTFYHYLMYHHLERGLPFGYASRELNPATEVIPNLLSIALQSNAWTQDLNSMYQTKARDTIANWQLYFAPGYGYFSIEEIEQWFTTLKDQGVNHFLFDHFHYALQGEDYESTARLIKELKSLTKRLDIHLSLIVQPRSLREGEQLSLATLRGGAAIGQALDNLLILERVKNEQNISKLTLEVARHKLAKLGSIFLQYDTNTTSFVEVEKSLIVDEPIPQGMDPRGKYGNKEWPRVRN